MHVPHVDSLCLSGPIRDREIMCRFFKVTNCTSTHKNATQDTVNSKQSKYCNDHQEKHIILHISNVVHVKFGHMHTSGIVI